LKGNKKEKKLRIVRRQFWGFAKNRELIKIFTSDYKKKGFGEFVLLLHGISPMNECIKTQE